MQPNQPLDRLEKFLLYTYLIACIYPVMVALVKASILCLYLRIFAVNRRFATIVKCFLAIDVAWAIGTLFAIVFQCVPVQATWDLSIQHKTCTASAPSLIATNVPDIVIDFCLMALPMPMIWQLKLSTRRKIGLTAIFALGAR